MRARRFVAAVVSVVIVVGLASSAGAGLAPSVKGAGIVTLPSWFGDVAGDRVVFELNTHGSGEQATGRFSVVHLDHEGGLYAHAVGEVTCVSVVDGIAVTTGVIQRAWFRDFPGWDVAGTAAAITVADGGANDILGFDFEFFESSITPCGKVEPFASVDHGNFTVR
jgi:hypothetical protein